MAGDAPGSPGDAVIDPVAPRSGGEPGRMALLVSSGGDLDTLVRLAGKDPSMNSGRVFASRLHSMGSQERRITLAGPFIGAPYSSMLLETLIAWGIRKFVLLGWCGAIAESVAVGDVVIPDAAVVDEGTSRHYRTTAGSAPATPCPRLTASLAALLSPFCKTVHRGTVWTTDAIYRETREKVSRHSAEGVLAVEMEASALFSVAAFRGVAMAACLVVSDELGSLKWRPGFHLDTFKTTRRKVAEGLLEVCPRL